MKTHLKKHAVPKIFTGLLFPPLRMCPEVLYLWNAFHVLPPPHSTPLFSPPRVYCIFEGLLIFIRLNSRFRRFPISKGLALSVFFSNSEVTISTPAATPAIPRQGCCRRRPVCWSAISSTSCRRPTRCHPSHPPFPGCRFAVVWKGGKSGLNWLLLTSFIFLPSFATALGSEGIVVFLFLSFTNLFLYETESSCGWSGPLDSNLPSLSQVSSSQWSVV